MPNEKDIGAEAGQGPRLNREFAAHLQLSVALTISEHERGSAHLTEAIRSISNEDAAERYREEARDNGVPANEQMDATYPTDDAGKTIVSWAENDRDNPYNWSNVRPSF